jgi:ATP-dependent DNA helicase DinG
MVDVAMSELFGANGALAKSFSGFQSRVGQIEMAEQVESAIQKGQVLVMEAGTGTGKTLAYLVPAILSGKKTLISTATKTLQDQLFKKDLPAVRKALGKPLRVALLKGRSNYLCLYRVENHLGFKGGMGLLDARQLDTIRRWSKVTRTGDIAEVHDVPEQSPLWAQATSTVDNCLGSECPKSNDCFMLRARSLAREADLLVVNHHLLWADWTIRQEGQGGLFKEMDAIVVDEAHQFQESAAQFLGVRLSSRQLKEWVSDLAIEQGREAPDVGEILEKAALLERRVDDFRRCLGADELRQPLQSLLERPDVVVALTALQDQLHELKQALEPLTVRGKGLEACHQRIIDLLMRLHNVLDQTAPGHVIWFETRKSGFSLNRTPIDIAKEFQSFQKERPTAWVFTSATLTVDGDFTHFHRELGITQSVSKSWESPFDYPNNSLLYLPQGLPDPSDRQYVDAMITAAIPVLKASAGRAFLLFTSHQALGQAARLIERHLDYPLFIQGQQPKSLLLEAFKRSDHGVLLGTSTFWEGVDVQGSALSCVIIDKLPFASPGDPVLSAKIAHLRAQGQNPFMSYQLPQAIIMLKQGVGRLIRDHTDRGVLMLCDPRLLSKPYGRRFIDSLPPIPRSSDIGDIERFFEPQERSTDL